MNRLGIKYQILLVTFIPAVLIDVFFTYLHIDTSITQAEEILQERGAIISKQIAGASEFNLYSGNDRQIQYLLDQTIDTNEIVLAAVYNFEGELIVRSESKDFLPDQLNNYYHYHQPIKSESIIVSDVFAPDQNEGAQNQVLGWVNLYISRQNLEETKSQVIRESVVIFVFILIITLVITIVISRGITTPIFKLMEHLRRVETGHLGELIEPLEANEIGAVQRGFNRMTQSLQTNRKHLNERIQQATQQLSEAITDLETKNRELGFARDEAQNANRIKSEFLANMSHEIRTPINGIKGFIKLMGQSDLPSRQKRYADIILKSANDLTDIINEILDFSKLESGKLQIIEEDFDLYEVVEQTRDILFINVISKNIDLILVIYSDTPRYVCGDKLRLKQVLLNLIGNAIKFTDHGRVVVRVSSEQALNNEVDIIISVEDTGIGISSNDQEDIFTAFSQVETAANRRYTGTGLGLVISKNLINLMGGEISLKSTAGQGSTFSIRLPFTIPLNSHHLESARESLPTALIFASQQACLQEIRSLFDRAGLETEGILVEQSQSAEQIRERILQNINSINLVVFDLRHMVQNLGDIIDKTISTQVKVIVMHYDPSMVPEPITRNYEFISNITTSSYLRKLLINTPPKGHSEQFLQATSSLQQTGKEVLIVDDNQINLRLAAEFIHLWGHQPTEALHAHAAMAYYKQKNFDLIILDIQMPDVDGTELLKMMREEKPDDPTPFVALTANVLPEESKRLLNIGFDYYLSKPIDEEKFRAILDGNTLKPGVIEKDRAETEDTLDIEIPKTIDLEKSLALSANNETIMLKMFEILLREIPLHQNQLESALLTSDRVTISSVVHKIHGITCYASLPTLRRQVLSIQQRMIKQPDEPINVEVKGVIAELSNVKTETEVLLATGTGIIRQAEA